MHLLGNLFCGLLGIEAAAELPLIARPMNALTSERSAAATAERRPDNSVDPAGEFPLGPHEYFFYLLFQAARQRDLQFNRTLKPSGLNVALFRSLAIIRRLEACTMSRLALFSTIERTTLTRSVDQLVARGLVVRSIPGHDRRQVNLALTDLGEATYLGAVQAMKAMNADLLAEVGPERLREVTRVLQHALRELAGSDELAEDLLSFGRAAG